MNVIPDTPMSQDFSFDKIRAVRPSNEGLTSKYLLRSYDGRGGLAQRFSADAVRSSMNVIPNTPMSQDFSFKGIRAIPPSDEGVMSKYMLRSCDGRGGLAQRFNADAARSSMNVIPGTPMSQDFAFDRATPPGGPLAHPGYGIANVRATISLTSTILLHGQDAVRHHSSGRGRVRWGGLGRGHVGKHQSTKEQNQNGRQTDEGEKMEFRCSRSCLAGHENIPSCYREPLAAFRTRFEEAAVWLLR